MRKNKQFWNFLKSKFFKKVGLYNYKFLVRKRLWGCWLRYNPLKCRLNFLKLKRHYRPHVFSTYVRYRRRKRLFFSYLVFVKNLLKTKLNLYYRVNMKSILENDFHFQWMLRRSKRSTRNFSNSKKKRLNFNDQNRVSHNQKFRMRRHSNKRNNFFGSKTARRWL